MTQSLINNGKEGNGKDEMNAKPKWICGSEFKARPLNDSGLPRVELLRKKSDMIHFLAIKVAGKNEFIEVQGKYCGRVHGGDSVEVKIIEIR